MYARICGSLDRQAKALELLRSLMKEEFSLLVSDKVDEITGLEFSIHELLRQLADEKEAIMAALGGGKVLDYAQMLQEEQRLVLQDLYKQVDRNEQLCARQAHMNSEISLALLKQGEYLINELTKAVTPVAPQPYGRKGQMYKPTRADAMLISGRL